MTCRSRRSPSSRSSPATPPACSMPTISIDHTFSELPDLLSPGDVVVVNRSRVRAARLLGTKVGGGGRVEALLLRPVTGRRVAGRGPSGPSASSRNRHRLRRRSGRLSKLNRIEGLVEMSLEADGPIEDAIAAAGTVPLPPYIHEPLADPERYQTIFARPVGSAAAPTAGLHFTPGVVTALQARSIEVVEIELRVGLDTFRPISTANIEDHQIHSESLTVPPEAAVAINDRRGKVVAVGTTVVRAWKPGQTPTVGSSRAASTPASTSPRAISSSRRSTGHQFPSAWRHR